MSSRVLLSDPNSQAKQHSAAVDACHAGASPRANWPAVLRLLRGEDLEMVSRSLGVTAATLSTWRDAFLAAGEASLSTRPMDGEALQGERLKARLGEMLLERELLEAKIALLEARDPSPLARARRRR